MNIVALSQRAVALSLLLFISLFSGANVRNARAATLSPSIEVQNDHDNPAENVDKAARWLVDTHQNDDGGFTSFSGGANLAPSDSGGTVDALIALGKAGAETDETLSYLERNVEALTEYASQDGSTAGKTIVALAASGADPRNFGGHDFVEQLTGHLSASGAYGVETAFNQSLAILGADASGEAVPDGPVRWLSDLQSTEGELTGSWDDGFGTPGNADTTAMALMALHAAGVGADDERITSGLDFLESTQLSTAGWEYGQGFGENANSTALVMQALGSLGEDVAGSESRWAVGERTPVDALLDWQSDNGAFQADFGDGPADDFFSTVQALAAVADVANPSEGEVGPAFIGGDSPVPYWLLGVLVLLLLAAGYFMLGRRG